MVFNMKKIYLDNGYFNFEYMYNKPTPFNFCWGGRGTGKTYGSIQYLTLLGEPFIYLRRMQSQTDLVLNDKLNPFKTPLTDLGYTFHTDHIGKNVYAIMGHRAMDEEDHLIAVCLALSTISNVRGFDGSDFKYLIFDEFIPESHARTIKNEADAFFNAYETIDRNRQLNGHDPLKVFAFSNSDNAVSPIFIKLELLEIAIGMQDRHDTYLVLQDRGISLYNLCDSPISAQKRETALYKAVGDGAFTSMALDNDFQNLDRGNVRSMPLKQLTPIVNVGEITIYRIKGKREFYISPHKINAPVQFSASDIDLQRFRAAFGYLWIDYLKYKVFSENLISEKIFLTYFKKS